MAKTNVSVLLWQLYDDLPSNHTHKKEKFYNGLPFMYNVSLDAHNNRPVAIDEAIADIRAKTEEYLNLMGLCGL